MVYAWESSSWIQIGGILKGTCVYSHISENQVGRYLKFGASVSMLGDGKVVAVGSGTSYQGEVRVYEWKSSVWTQVGTTMDNYAEEYCA